MGRILDTCVGEKKAWTPGGKRPLQAGKGLSGLVSAINKKPKMGCLDKSKLDWDTYVAKEGIREELETFNKAIF